MRGGMSAEEADDLVSELGTAEIARRYGWGPRPYGPPDRLTCMEEARSRAQRDAVLAPALAAIDRMFAARR